jgi:sterol desaturase/sphingolipid hydroxylase (fatty acid hydroxylase superfamily)
MESSKNIAWFWYFLLIKLVTNSYHDFHHSVNIGNFDTGGQFLDSLFKTNGNFYRREGMNKKS